MKGFSELPIEVTYFYRSMDQLLKVKDQIEFPETIIDSSNYYEIYERNKKSYVQPDSIQIGGVFFPLQPTDIEIPPIEIYDYYKTNKYNFYQENSVKFDYIFIRSNTLVYKVLEYAKSTKDFAGLKFCFNEKDFHFNENYMEFSSLPSTIRNQLSQLSNGKISNVFAYQDGWMILKRINSFKAETLKFEDVKSEIADLLKIKEAKKRAYLSAKAFFDSVSYFSQCYNLDDQSNIFKTSFLPIDSEFEKIGSIMDIRAAILRLYKNEKYSSVLETNNGYAVIFLLKKNLAKKLSFEEALPVIKQNLQIKKRIDTGVHYLSYIRDKILKGKNPNALLTFFGGWKRVKNLKLNQGILGDIAPTTLKLMEQEIPSEMRGKPLF